VNLYLTHGRQSNPQEHFRTHIASYELCILIFLHKHTSKPLLLMINNMPWLTANEVSQVPTKRECRRRYVVHAITCSPYLLRWLWILYLSLVTFIHSYRI